MRELYDTLLRFCIVWSSSHSGIVQYTVQKELRFPGGQAYLGNLFLETF